MSQVFSSFNSCASWLTNACEANFGRDESSGGRASKGLFIALQALNDFLAISARESYSRVSYILETASAGTLLLIFIQVWTRSLAQQTSLKTIRFQLNSASTHVNSDPAQVALG